MGSVYRVGSYRGSELVGEVDSDGQVYRHDDTLGNELVGKVDPHGQVYRHAEKELVDQGPNVQKPQCLTIFESLDLRLLSCRGRI